MTVRLQGSRTRAQAEKQLLRALQALAVGQGQGQSEARQLGGQSCLGGQVWLPCGGLAGGLTACCSRPGTGPPASRRNCTDISRMDAMSSRRPSNWGSRARRRSQLKEIRLLLSEK